MTDTQRHAFDNYYMHHFFSDVYSNARTGVLKVYFQDDVVKTVYFSEGNTIYASSNGEKDKLVNILIKYKKLSREQLETALRQMDKRISLGRNLVNMGFITHKELIWAVKVQVIGIMHSIITLREGEYQFTEGPLPEGVINLPLNTMKVLFDSLLMFQDRTWISDQVHYPNAVYKKTILFEEGKNRLMTNAELLQVAEAIDGEKTVEDLAGLSTIEDFKVFKLLYALRFLNLIEEKIEEPELEAGEQIFEIADEPEEALELAEESLGQLADREGPEAGEQATPVSDLSPTGGEASDEIPLTEITQESEQEGVAIGTGPDATLIETIRPGAQEPEDDSGLDGELALEEEQDASQLTEEHTGNDAQGDDVYVEFQLEQTSQSVDETLPMGVPSVPSDEDTARLEDAPVSSVREGIALTEEDLDSVILGEDQSGDEASETVHMDRDSMPMGEGDASSSAELTSQDSVSFSEEIIMPDSSGGNWLLLTLILITVAVGTAALYYYKFWLPEQTGMPAGQHQAVVQNEPVQLEAPGSDITTNSVSVDQTGDLTAESDLSQSEAQAGAVESNATSEPPAVETPAAALAEKSTSSTEPTPMATDERHTPEAMPAESSSPEPAPGPTGGTDKPAQPVATDISQSRIHQEVPAAVPTPSKTQDRSEVLPVPRATYDEFVEQARVAFDRAAGQFTLQLEIACQAETLQQAIDLLKPTSNLYLIPFRLGGTDCFIVAYGIYPDRATAEQALLQIPEVFFEGNDPFVASVDGLRKRLP